MEVIDIDQVKGLPATTYNEREINLIEPWQFSYPVLVGVSIVQLFDFGDYLPVLDYQKVSCTHMNNHFVFTIFQYRNYVFVCNEY